MCDVLVAMPDATVHGRTIFGKNSDRPAGETQILQFSPGGKRASGARIVGSYVTIPDAKRVLATVGCRPYWSWGYETGTNEAGVVGGNAAIYTRSFHKQKNRLSFGLTGMELLRLGLERGETAEENVEIIADLLEQYGQWGSAVQGLDHEKGSYENSFLLADSREAWIMETTGRRWVAEPVSSGVRSISNQPTIQSHHERCSPDLMTFAREKGWWDPAETDFDFAYCYGDHEHYSRQVSHIRWKRSTDLLEKNRGGIDVSTMMGILRDHYEGTFLEGPQFHPYLPDFHSICMHRSPSGFTWGNTATSFIMELDETNSSPAHVWVVYLPPCSSVYLVIPFLQELPDTVTRAGKTGLKVRPPAEAPGDLFDESSLWWRLNRLVEQVTRNPAQRQKELRSLLDPIEQKYLRKVDRLQQGTSPKEKGEWTLLLQEELSDLMNAIQQLEKAWQITYGGYK